MTALPFLCRDALDGGDWPLAREPDQIWEVLEIVLEVARDQSGETYGLRDPQDAVAGLITVLVKFHREWLRADPERERACLENFLCVPERAARSLPELFGASSGETVWAFFCAEQLPLTLGGNSRLAINSCSNRPSRHFRMRYRGGFAFAELVRNSG